MVLFKLNDFKVISKDFIDVLSSKTQQKKQLSNTGINHFLHWMTVVYEQAVIISTAGRAFCRLLDKHLTACRKIWDNSGEVCWGSGTHYQCLIFRWGVGWGGIWHRDRLRGFFMASLVLSIMQFQITCNLFAGQCCSSPQNYLKVKKSLKWSVDNGRLLTSQNNRSL